MVDIKKQVETLLFATGRSLTLKELSELTKQESLEDIKKAFSDMGFEEEQIEEIIIQL